MPRIQVVEAPDYLYSKGWRQQGDFWVKGKKKLLEHQAFDLVYKKQKNKVFIVQESLFGNQQV